MAGAAEESIIEDGSGNVFADLDLTDAEEMLVKAKLASAIQDVIEARRLSRSKAAELMGVDTPSVDRILRGRLSEFSAEAMLHFLLHLGSNVDIVIHRPVSGGRAEGAISVAYV